MRPSGFTLAESLLVMTVLGVVSAFGVPRIRHTMYSISVRSARATVTTHAAKSRAAAVQRGCRSVLHVTPGSNGHVWVTACALRGAGRDTLGGVDPVAARFGVALVPSRDSIQYDPRGLSLERAVATVGISRGGVADSLMINELGKVVR